MNKLFWNGKEVELSDKTKIGITYQVSSIDDLQNRKGNFSNIFKLPKTAKNTFIFGYLNNVNSLNQTPYTVGLVDYYEDEFPIVQNGLGYIEMTDGSINLRLTSGNGTFFGKIGELTVGQLYENECWIRGEYIWFYRNEILSSRDGSKDYIFPLVNCTENAELIGSSNEIYMRRMLPFLFGKSIFNKVAEINGYELTGDFIDSNIFQKILLSPDNVNYSQDIIKGIVSPKTNQEPVFPFYNAGNGGFFGFPNPNFTGFLPSTGVGGGTFTYYFNHDSEPFFLANFSSGFSSCETLGDFNDTIGFKGSIKFDYKIGFEVTDNNVSLDPPIEYGIQILVINNLDNSVVYEETLLDNNDNNYGSFEFEGSFNVSGIFLPKTEYFCRIRVKLQESQTAGFTYKVYDPSILPSTTQEPIFKTTSVDFANEQIYGGILFFNQLFNIKVKDFIKDVLNQFSVIPDVNDITKKAKFFFSKNQRKNKKNAIDWSKKVDPRSVEIRYKFQNKYAQKNNFKYKENEFVLKNYGDGIINVNDQQLEGEKDVVTLFTSATESFDENGLLIPRIKMYQNDWTPNNCNSRILLLSIENTLSNYNFIDGVESAFITNQNIPFAYFKNPLYQDSLDFNDLIKEYYATLLIILEGTKIINIYVYLNSLDIQNLNYEKPIYMNCQVKELYLEGYFILQKIDKYTGGLTKCELIKI